MSSSSQNKEKSESLPPSDRKFPLQRNHTKDNVTLKRIRKETLWRGSIFLYHPIKEIYSKSEPTKTAQQANMASFYLFKLTYMKRNISPKLIFVPFLLNNPSVCLWDVTGILWTSFISRIPPLRYLNSPPFGSYE